MPVASDLPIIDCTLIEAPNPLHPFGVRGVGEIAIVPTVANAVRHATGVRFFELPMSPPKVLQRLAEAQHEKVAT
jgi:CO/xanthine dehydrogenase Mo-binding subunit